VVSDVKKKLKRGRSRREEGGGEETSKEENFGEKRVETKRDGEKRRVQRTPHHCSRFVEATQSPTGQIAEKPK
jgi:hypothetical protein